MLQKDKPASKKPSHYDSDDEDTKEDKNNHVKSLTGEIPEDEKILNDFKSEPAQNSYLNSADSRGCVEEVVEEQPLSTKKDNSNLPNIRDGGSKKVDFTEKAHPNMPARESQRKEAPFPKSKRLNTKKPEDDLNITIEDRDPVWLKDKGDHFYKRHDYNSAVNAYSKSIKHDPEFLKCYLNRATTLLKMRNPDGAILDLDDIEMKVNAQTEEEKKDPFYHKLMARTLVKRGAAFAWTSEFEKAEADLERALSEYKTMFTEVELEYIRKDLVKINKRKESNEIKKKGDKLYAQSHLEKALREYEEALSKDPTNEYALGNIGLIYLKRSDYNKCIEYTDLALAEITNFISDTKSFNTDNQLEVKLLLRRGKSYQMVEKYQLAKNDLDECVKLDRRNKEAANMLKNVQTEINEILFKENKVEAERLFTEKKWSEALEYFEQCLKITRKASTLNNISVFVNKTACLLALEQIDTLLSECNNALRLIKNFKVKDTTKEEKEKARKMEVILLLRKGKGLLKQNHTQKAIEQYECALDIDPENEIIKKDVEKLKQSM